MKFDEEDKVLITLHDNRYNTLYCSEHGVYSLHKNRPEINCPWCNAIGEPIKNIGKLIKKYKEELGFD